MSHPLNHITSYSRIKSRNAHYSYPGRTHVYVSDYSSDTDSWDID